MARNKKVTEYDQEAKKIHEIAVYNELVARLRRAGDYGIEKLRIQVELTDKEFEQIKKIVSLIDCQKHELEAIGVYPTKEELEFGINPSYHISKDWEIKYFIEPKKQKPQDNQVKMKTK